MAPETGKTRETRLRRQAERQGLRLQKSPRRDPRARDFGTYQLVDAREGWVVAEQMTGQGFGMSLDDVEEWLNGKAVCMYKVTALMKVRPFPAPSAAQRQRFADAIGAAFSSHIVQPSVRWDGDTHAQVTLAFGGENATKAGNRAKEFIDRNAANVAHLYVTGIEVAEAEPLEK